jgi:hypothetical protein
MKINCEDFQFMKVKRPNGMSTADNLDAKIHETVYEILTSITAIHSGRRVDWNRQTKDLPNSWNTVNSYLGLTLEYWDSETTSNCWEQYQHAFQERSFPHVDCPHSVLKFYKYQQNGIASELSVRGKWNKTSGPWIPTTANKRRQQKHKQRLGRRIMERPDEIHLAAFISHSTGLCPSKKEKPNTLLLQVYTAKYNPDFCMGVLSRRITLKG